MARGILAEGRLLDAYRMIEPLVDRTDNCANPTDDPAARRGQIMLRCLLARVHLLRHADPRKVGDLLSAYEPADVRAGLESMLRAEVALWLGWARAWQDDERYDEARALNLLDEAQRGFEETMDPSGRCWTRIAQAHAYLTIDEYELMMQALSEAASIQERLSDRAARSWIDHLSVIGARFEGRYPAALKHAEALQRFGEELHDDYALGRAHAHRAVLEFELGRRPEDIIAMARRAESLLSRSAVNPGYCLMSAYHAHIGAAMRAGQWKQADRLVDEAMARVGFLETAPGYIMLHRARLCEYRGDLDEALELLDDMGKRIDRQHRLLAAGVSLVRARVLMRRKNFDSAREHADRALRYCRDAGHVGFELRALLVCAQIEITRKRKEEARRLVREAERHGDYFSILPIAAQRFLIQGYLAALSERSEDARAYFTQALSAFSLIGDVYSVAVAQCALAYIGTSAGEVRNYATSALHVCEDLGAAPLAREARRLLRNAPLHSSSSAEPEEANIGAIMAQAAISVDLVAEAWLQAAEALAPGRWLVVYSLNNDESWTVVHQRGQVPDDLDFPDPAVDRLCENGVDWIRLRGLPAPAYFFGMECGGEDDPACAAIERRLEPWIPVVGLALEHALLRSSRLSISSDGRAARALDGSVQYSTGIGMTAASMSGQIRRVRSGHSPVLIMGERGVGRQRVARTIHQTGDRRDGPFVSVRCSTRPAEALESLLFDSQEYEHGAFLSADGGSLYLEDIDELPLEMQSRLIHYLREGTAAPPGGGTPSRADVRILASSIGDLQERVRDGSFREELYYRLSLLPIWVPALRERREEVPLLVQQFLRDFTTHRSSTAAITSRALDVLIRYDWPGNVRQLRNEIERLVEEAGSEPFLMIDVEDLSPAIQHFRPDAPSGVDGVAAGLPLEGRGLEDILATAERSVIEQALRRHDGQVSATADLLGLSRQGLYKKLKRLGIDLSDFQARDTETVSEPS